MMRWIFRSRFNWFDVVMIIACVKISTEFGCLVGAIFIFCAGIFSAAGEMRWVNK
jgi:hypothetical protein